MHNSLTIINYSNLWNVCIQGVWDSLVHRTLCMCTTVAISIALAVTRVGCPVMFSVLEGKCSALHEENSSSILIFVEYRQSISTSFLPFSCTHAAAVASKPPLRLPSSTLCFFALRLNIIAFFFYLCENTYLFAVDYYCVIENESLIFEYSTCLKVRTRLWLFDHILSKLRCGLFGLQPVTTSRVFWPVSEMVNIFSIKLSINCASSKRFYLLARARFWYLTPN